MSSVDGTLSPMLLKLIRLADWTVIVSDSTAEGNEKSSKLLDSLEAIDSMDEKLIVGKMGVIFNRFGSTGQKLALPKYASELGTIPRHQNADKAHHPGIAMSSVYSRMI